MCLAVPLKLVKISGDRGWVDTGGGRKEVSLALIEGVKEGDYILVHAGFAIQKLSLEEAEETLRIFEEIENATR